MNFEVTKVITLKTALLEGDDNQALLAIGWRLLGIENEYGSLHQTLA